MITEFDASTAASRTAAAGLIAETRHRSAEFPEVLANHLPMVLAILTRLGATPERLVAYAEAYVATNRVPLLAPSVASVRPGEWRALLGNRAREADLRAFFVDEVAQRGAVTVVREAVPVLARGIGASALHPLMRLAYGVLRSDDAEIGTALGYWAATCLPLPDPPAEVAETDEPLDVLLALRRHEALLEIRPETDLLWHAIRAVGSRPETIATLGRLRVGPGTLDRIASASLALYASTMTFEAVHALTGAHWLRLVTPMIEDPAPLLRSFWHVILSVYPKIGMPEPVAAETLDAWRHIPAPDDREIAAAAVASDDEHDPSLVFSALHEFARTGDPLYRVVAARRVGLLPVYRPA